MRYIAIALVASAPLIAHGAIYKCQVDGSIHFQDQPCVGAHSSVVTIHEDHPANPPAPPVSISNGGGSQRLQPLSAAADAPDRNKPIATEHPVSRYRSPHLCQRPSGSQIRKAELANRVILCMTKAEVLDAVGEDYTDHQTYQSSEGETWFFPMHPETFPESVKFDRAGRVTYWGAAQIPTTH